MIASNSTFFGNTFVVPRQDSLNEGYRAAYLQHRLLSTNGSPLRPPTQRIRSGARLLSAALFALLAFSPVTATNARAAQLSGAAPIKASPQLSVGLRSLDFGSVALSSTGTQTLTLRSTGTAAVVVNSIAVSGEDFSISGASFPLSLEPGKTVDLHVYFQPKGTGDATGEITVNSTSASSPVTTVALAGSGANAAVAGDPRLTVFTAALNFGDVTTGSPTSQAVTLLSSGTAPVEVTSANLTGSGFSIDDTIFPITLKPNQQISLPVQFNPAAPGSIHGEISFNSNSIDGAATVSLAANGVASLAPQLTVSPGAVSFGSATIGSPLTQNLTLTSTGSSAVTVTSVKAAGAGFTISNSSLPVTLNPGEQETLQVQFNPVAAGVATGKITVYSTSSGNPVVGVLLSGTGAEAPHPQLAFATGAVSFGLMTIGRPAMQTVTLSSTGTAPVTVNSAVIRGAGFTLSGSNFPVTLDPGKELTLDVQFNPTTTGSATGQLTVNSTSSGNPVSIVTLSGAGTTLPVSKLSAASKSVDFGAVTLGSSTTQSLAPISAGSAPVTVKSVTVSGAGFTVSGNSFPVTLNPGQQFPLDVRFNPTATGTSAGRLTVNTASATDPTASVNLTGIGATVSGPNLTVSPLSVTFSSVTIGWPGTRYVTLTSTGTSAVTVNSATISGTGFSVSGVTFPVTLSPQQTVTLKVKFNPTVPGTVTGKLTIKSNSSVSPTIYIPITGTGATSSSRVLSVSPTNLGFGTVTIGSPVTKTVTLTSTGTSSVTVNSATISGAGFSVSGSSYPVTLNPKQTLTLQVKFNPTVAGTASGQLTIKSNSSSYPTMNVGLTGTGATSSSVMLAVSTTNLSFGSVTIGSPSTQSITLTSTGTSAVTVNSAAISGAGFSVSGSSFPVTLSPKQAVTLQVKFNPTVTGTVTGQLTIKSTSTSNPTVFVSLSGTGSSSTSQHQVSLAWSPPSGSSPPVAGYRIYRATGSSTSFTLLNSALDTSPSYVDSAVQSGQSYTYYVTSVSSTGVESSPSAKATTTVP